jgi:hypothetical protein
MGEKKVLAEWFKFERIEPALVTGLALFITSFSSDALLDWWGVPVTATILNNLMIGTLGALAVMFYLSASHERHNLERAKERIALVGEVNRQVREVLGEVGRSAILEDREERLRRLDEVTDRMDSVLSDLAPGPGAGGAARGFGKRRD